MARSLLTYDPVQRFLQRQVERSLPPGPSKEDRARGRAVVVAEAWDDTGGHASSMLATPEPYELTARTAVEIARMAADGEAVPGYQTPSTAYGADLIMRFDGVLRTNL